MRDNFDELKDIFNRELKSISVSEELKSKTLEKCKKHKKNLMQRGLIPVTLTIEACLLVGIIIYPIYNKNNLIGDEAVTMKSSNKDIKPKVEPSINAAMFKDKDNITGEENKEIPLEDNKNTSIELAKDNEENFNGEVKMKTLSISIIR